MCLTNIPADVQEFVTKHEGKTSIIAYKFIEYVNGKLTGPFYTTYTYQPGDNIADVNKDEVELKAEKRVEKGIHVYLTKESADKQVKKWNRNEFQHATVAVSCLLEDLIGVNLTENQAVFSKVNLTQEEYDAALTETKTKFEAYIKEYNASK